MSGSITHIKEIIVVLTDHYSHSERGYAIYKTAHNEDGEVWSILKSSIDEKSVISNNSITLASNIIRSKIISPEMSTFRFLYQTCLSNAVLTVCRMMEAKRNQDTFFDILKKAKKLPEKPARLNEIQNKFNALATSEQYKRLKQFRDNVLAHNAKYHIPSHGISDLEFCLDEVGELIELNVEIFMNETWHSQNRRTYALSSASYFWNLLID